MAKRSVDEQIEAVLTHATGAQRAAHESVRQATLDARYADGYAAGVLDAVAASKGMLGGNDDEPQGNLVKFPVKEKSDA